MGLFPTNANDGDEVTNAGGTTFKYVAADDKWIIKSAGVISDIAYNAGTWDANSDGATKNAIRDKIEAHDALPDIHHAKQHAMDSATYHTSSNVATLNATTTKHGFLKKLDNNAANFMNGQGNWAVPPGEGVDFTFDDTVQWHWKNIAGWTVAQLTVDGNWHDLDVSSKCAANETAVFMLYVLDAAVAGVGGYVREDGATNNYYQVYTSVVNKAFMMTCILNVGATRKIEYKGDNNMDRLLIQYMGAL